MPDEDPYRLPRHATPRHYDVTLAPDIDAATFTGSVSIDLSVTEATSVLWCNALDLIVESAELERDGARHALTAEIDASNERLALRATDAIAPGDVRLHLSFRGPITDQLRGFYRSSFTAPDGTKRAIATTQFQATDARRAFPCWDEPEYKASFAITLDIADGLLAVSNSPIVSDTARPGGGRRVRFAPTMAMSTYLVAFVIGPLEATDPIDVDGIELRVVHTPGNAHLTAFALESAAFALRYLREYYGIAYPGEKLDLVAIPDFAFGAMENLGCVTFRETLLLVDPDNVPQPELQRVADVIHHELAHMWFGDLVTMRWWNGIWLNEAFATFMEMKCTDAFRPQWHRWNDFGLSRSAAMDVDSLAATRPIEVEVRSPSDAEAMFDLLTYEKGAAVVRMLEQYVGEDAFRRGIHNYLSRHSYGSTETHDLWDAIEEATGEPVRQMMDTWIFQGGHPHISLRATADGRTEIEQHRFSYLPTEARHWTVPVRVRANGAEHRVLLGPTPVHIDVPAESIESANVAGTGFYRVRLSDERLAAIGRHGAETDDAIERYGLVDDTWAMALAGEVRATQFLDFAEGFGNETELAVWQRLIGSLDAIERAVQPSERPALHARIHALLAPARARLGLRPIEGERGLDRELRATLLEADALIAGDAEAIASGSTLRNNPDVGPALVAAGMRIAAAHGDTALFGEYVDALNNAATPQDAERFRNALTLFPGVGETRRVVDLMLDGTIRSQDAPFLGRSLLRNRHQGETAWRLLTERWEDVNRTMPSNLVVRLLEGISSLAEPAFAAEVDAFLEAHPVPQNQTVMAQHRERLRVHAAFRSRTRTIS